MLSPEPAVCMTLLLEGRQWSLTLSQGLGQARELSLSQIPQTRGGSPGLRHARSDIQLVTSLPAGKGRRQGEAGWRRGGQEEQAVS